MTESEFIRQQQAAVERMREMNARAAIYKGTEHKMPPTPAFVRVPEKESVSQNTVKQRHSTPKSDNLAPTVPEARSENTVKKQGIKEIHTSPSGLNIPFLDTLLTDRDTALIIGLLLILISENSDKMLLFALIYILM